MAEALYRKYRPQVFEDVVGQEPIERTLKNAIAQDKVSHAYLFCGPRGTGKTTTARLLAKALLCQAGPTPEPDGTCEDCRLIAEGLHPDVYELDAASRTGVENVREEIISRVQFAPTRGRSKIYIIDEVHMLSTAAFNALLKTLEEPPSHVVFVLCTTDPQKVPETIHSRCQRFDFRRIAPESMVSRLGAICIAEGVEFEGEALDLVAHRAEGGLRNALTSLEQIIAFENGKVTLAGAERLLGSIDSNDMAEIVSSVGERDIASCFRWTAAYVETGADLAQFVRDMAEHIRNLYVLALVGDDVELDISETTRHQMISELQWFGPDRLARLMGVLGDLSSELKTSSNPRLAFEIALTRMVRPDSDLTLESLAERIEALEGGYSAVAHVLPGTSMQAANADRMSEGYAVIEPFEESVPAQMPVSAHPQGAQPESVQPQFREQVREQVQEIPRWEETAGEEQLSREAQQTMPNSGKLAILENPATVQRVWQAALSSIKKQKQAYGVLFMNAKASFDAGTQSLRVAFPAEAAFAYNAVQKAEVQEALAAALAHAVGGEVPFRYEQTGQSGSTESRQVASRSQVQVQPQPQPQMQPIVQAQPHAQAEPQVQQQVQPQPQVQVQPTVQAQPQVQMQPQQQPQAQPQPQLQEQRTQNRAQFEPSVQVQPQSPPAFDDYPPYDDIVPYDDVPYEAVPYEEFEAPASGGAFGGAAVDQFSGQMQPSIAGAKSQKVPGAETNAQTRIASEAQPDVEALLQAGFGGNVIFSEVED